MKKQLVSLLISVAALSAALPAFACGNGIEHRLFPEVDELASAESQLHFGNLETAARGAAAAIPGLREKKYVSGLRSLRAARVMALVMIRSGGAWLKDDKLTLPDEKGQTQNFDWAITQLRVRAEAEPKTSSHRVDLGEALAAVPRHHAEARKLLDGLSKTKLIHSPHAFAALARLHAEAGDEKAAAAATESCEKRARDKNICKASTKEASSKDEGTSDKA